MKEEFVNFSINYLLKNNACSESQINIFRYTLESIYSFVTKISVVLLLSFLLGTFKITLLFLFLYGILRGFTFGIHATKNIYCWITTIGVYILFPSIIKYLTVPSKILFLFLGIGVLAILFWAPADTPARPLFNKKKRIMNKGIALLIASFLLLFYFYSSQHNIREVIGFIFLLNAICICPITYKLFHISYNNYKNIDF